MTIKSDVFRFIMVFCISIEIICFVFVEVYGDTNARVLGLLFIPIIYFLISYLHEDFNRYEVLNK